MEERKFPAVLDQLSEIRAFAREAASRAGLEASGSYQLQLAVDEIATNIITHGYEEANQTGDVVMQIEVTEDLLRITMIDTGREFDPNSRMVDESDLSRPLEERAIGGLGIFLALEGVDKFTYRRSEGRNYNIFEMQRNKPGSNTAL